MSSSASPTKCFCGLVQTSPVEKTRHRRKCLSWQAAVNDWNRVCACGCGQTTAFLVDYEPRSFDVGLPEKPMTYTPDFWLPSLNAFVEVKGYWTDRSRYQLEEFKKRYAYQILIVGRLVYELLMKTFKAKVASWESTDLLWEKKVLSSSFPINDTLIRLVGG